jgi:hypothetical protein
MCNIFVTDVKLDDILAFMLLLRALKDSDEIKVVISDVNDTAGAAQILLGIHDEMARRTGLAPKLSFHVGDVRERPHPHEKMFKLSPASQVATQAVCPEASTEDVVFWMAPFTGALKFAKAREVFISMGHNLNSSGLSIEELCRIDNLVTMNNFQSYPKGEEGGRVTEAELTKIKGISSLFDKCVPFGLDNSIDFIGKQLYKFACGDKGGVQSHPSPRSADDVVSVFREDRESLIPYAKEVFQCFTGEPLCLDAKGFIKNPSNTYLDRVVEQIIKGVQLEVTDGQHMLVFLA